MPVDVSSLPIIKKTLNGWVGFSQLPNQYHRKSVKKGFEFTLMVVGESGLGKTTLVNSLFRTSLYPQKEPREPTAETPKTVDIQAISAEFEENGIKLHLTCIDTPGFGDYVNNEDSWRPILENIESRFDAFLVQEMRVNRRKSIDTRCHACLYFITPTGHSLKPLDSCHRVNLIPVIAKSDTMTDSENKAFKARILEDIAVNQISIYIPKNADNLDPETAMENKEIMSKIPFAIVGSDTEIKVGAKTVIGRQYPWGVIDIENEQHCDFDSLRKMLIRSHMEELREYTNDTLYEAYRIQRIKEGTVPGVARDPGVAAPPTSKFDQERVAHEQKMQKMESEMKTVFQQKVFEKETKLKQSEDELYARHREMKEQLERQRLEVEEKKKRGGKKTKGLFK